MENKIGFSHAYSKLHGQTFGILLSAKVIEFDLEKADPETIEYDTDGIFDISSDVENGKCLQLVFLGNKQIPFTTYRKPSADKDGKFTGHVGENFVFTFVGDKDLESWKNNMLQAYDLGQDFLVDFFESTIIPVRLILLAGKTKSEAAMRHKVVDTVLADRFGT